MSNKHKYIISQEDLVQLVNNGKSIQEIASTFKVSRSVIQYRLRKLGLKTKRSIDESGHRKSKLDLIGIRFGMLIPITKIRRPQRGDWDYICQCDCGNMTKPLSSGTLLRNTTTSCGCRRDQYSKIRGCNSTMFSGYKGIHGRVWSHIQKSAEARNLEFGIGIEYAWNLFEQQNGQCKLSGVPIKFSLTADGKDKTASLDRIDSTLGYTEGNVQWVHKSINLMKRSLNQEVFIDFCKRITTNAKD